MLLQSETYDIQKKLASFCRTGKPVDIPGTNTANLPHYRRLVYNIITDILESAFPITYKFLPKKEWESMTHDFFSNHACQTPQIWKLPLEFVNYIKVNYMDIKNVYPFLNDLLLFEWLEIELFNMEDEELPSFASTGDWMYDSIIMNPEYKMIAFKYPVHLFPPSQLSTKKVKSADYFLLIYRHPDTKRVELFNLSPLHVFVIEKIENQKKLNQIIIDACKFFNLTNKEELTTHLIS